MKIECKNRDLLIDGRDFTELSNEEKQNLWLRCVDYMRTHYDDGACRIVAAMVPCYFGEYQQKEGFTIEI